MSRAARFYLFATVCLVIAAVVGGVMLAVQHSQIQLVEIVLSQVQPPQLIPHFFMGRESPKGVWVNSLE